MKRNMLAEFMGAQLCHGGWSMPAAPDNPDRRDDGGQQLPVQPPPASPAQSLDHVSDMLVRS